MSPRRTEALHEVGHRHHLSTIVFVGFQRSDLGDESSLVVNPGCCDYKRGTDRF